ncbi:MAG: N-formylglutamate amidohydrolase [Gammaproteobacteria bacterium]
MSGLLAPDDPAPVLLEQATGGAPFVLTCDHAGLAIPEALADLGVPEQERVRHIGWDIGALGVARELARVLDAPLIAQRYSRLVIDCNRPPHSADLIPERSEAVAIPANCNLADAARQARIGAIYEPYHTAIRTVLDGRAASGQETIFVAIHSFTPIYLDSPRPWQLGVLYGRDRRLAQVLLTRLGSDGGLTVGDNQPYRIDGKDYGIPEHALARGLANVLFEIRQDLITTADAQQAWASRLAELLVAAHADLRAGRAAAI